MYVTILMHDMFHNLSTVCLIVTKHAICSCPMRILIKDRTFFMSDNQSQAQVHKYSTCVPVLSEEL
jgi:hypothetical protein